MVHPCLNLEPHKANQRITVNRSGGMSPICNHGLFGIWEKLDEKFAAW